MNTDALLNSVHSNANGSEERKSVNRIIVQNHFLEVLLKLTDNHTYTVIKQATVGSQALPLHCSKSIVIILRHSVRKRGRSWLSFSLAKSTENNLLNYF